MSVHHGEVEVGFGTGYLVHENVIHPLLKVYD
jgi:hypothetical protein